jgi:hypothetical protein
VNICQVADFYGCEVFSPRFVLGRFTQFDAISLRRSRGERQEPQGSSPACDTIDKGNQDISGSHASVFACALSRLHSTLGRCRSYQGMSDQRSMYE